MVTAYQIHNNERLLGWRVLEGPDVKSYNVIKSIREVKINFNIILKGLINKM